MTAPDLAALAAALHDAYCRQNVPMHRDGHTHDSTAIIAALDAQGGRITFEPEPGVGSGTTTDCPIEGVHEHPFRGPHRFTEWYDGPRMGGPFEDMSLDEFVDRTRLSVALIEQAAVRAALEGLRAEVTAEPSKTSIRDGSPSGRFVVDWLAVIALIDARITSDHSVTWPAGTWHGVLSPSADDPVSAPAARDHRPVWTDDVPTGWCVCGEPWPHVVTTTLPLVWSEADADIIAATAVRAALEGLVVEVVARKRQATMGPGQDSTDVDVAWAFDEAIALIRARLAALDA